MAQGRRAINARRIDEATWQLACSKVNEQRSPDQIGQCTQMSAETVYQRIYADKQAGRCGGSCVVRGSVRSVMVR